MRKRFRNQSCCSRVLSHSMVYSSLCNQNNARMKEIETKKIKHIIIETKVSLLPASFRLVASDQCFFSFRHTCNSFGDMLTLNHHHHHHPWLRTQINNCINCIRLIFSLRYAINALDVRLLTVVGRTESIVWMSARTKEREKNQKCLLSAIDRMSNDKNNLFTF